MGYGCCGSAFVVAQRCGDKRTLLQPRPALFLPHPGLVPATLLTILVPLSP